jgi:hypothetical protein
VYTALLIAFFFYAFRAVLRGPMDEAMVQPEAVQPGLVSAPAGQAAE